MAQIWRRRLRGAMVACGVVAYVVLPLALVSPVRAADPPFIQDIQPREAYAGAVVTIAGTSFGTAAGQVSFADVSGRRRATTQSWTDTSIRAEVPYNVVPGDVIVRTADGRTSNGFHFSPPCWDKPVIRSIVPLAAMSCEVVKITGCGFGDFQYEQVLTFNGVDATGTVIGNWSETELLVPVPDAAKSGPVVITNQRRVPSAGTPFTVLGEIPAWEKLPSIGRMGRSFEVDLKLVISGGRRPEDREEPPTLHTIEPWINTPANRSETRPVQWLTAVDFTQVIEHEWVNGDGTGGRRRWQVDGQVKPEARSVLARYRETSSGVQGTVRGNAFCTSEAAVVAELPLGADFNVWAPKFTFGVAGRAMEGRIQSLGYAMTCRLLDARGQPVGTPLKYVLEGIDWTGSGAGSEGNGLALTFEGAGKNPCWESDRKWSPSGQIHGQVYVPVPPAVHAGFTGFPADPSTHTDAKAAPLAGVPVTLLITPPGGAPREIARAMTDDEGRYRFYGVPLTRTVQMEVALEYQGVSPPGFRVTYSRPNNAPREAVRLRSRAFSVLDVPLLNMDIPFAAGTGTASIWDGALQAVGLAYAHTRQAWQTAGELGVTLDMHVNKGEPLEIRTFSPAPGTYWAGQNCSGPTAGPLHGATNVHVNIAAADSLAEDSDRPANREWHELGHHVQADIQGDLFPQYDNQSTRESNKNHAGRLNPTSQDSWVEGFAEFYALLVGRDAARDRQPGLYRARWGTVNLDVNYTSFGADLGRSEEFAVASLLWDLVDSAGDGFDVRPMAMTRTLLARWGVTLDTPLPKTSERWPPKLYGDRIALDDRVLLFLVAEADKIAKARQVQSPDSFPGYPWIFDVNQLYRTLRTMGVGQDLGASGLTALDELFVAHGFFADTAPQNLCYDPGETIGMTSNLRYAVTLTTGSRAIVPARPVRNAPPPPADSYLRFNARDAATGAPVAVSAFDVAVNFAPPYERYTYAYQAEQVEAGRLVLMAPDPIYATTLTVTPRGDRLTADAPFVISGNDYWDAVSRGVGADLFTHTFQVRRGPVRAFLPMALRGAGPASAPGGVSPVPPTPPSSAQFATELAALINAERERAGRTVLMVQSDLKSAAEWYARDMAASGDYRPDHSDRQGRTMPERVKALGYGPEGHPRWQVAENIARGQTTPAEVLAAWLDSPPHRANLLERDTCEMGVAHAFAAGDPFRHYWVVDFGCRSERATTPSIEEPAETPLTPPPAVTTPAPPTTTPRVSPTVTVPPGLGIQGRVTSGGQASAGTLLSLMREGAGAAVVVSSARTDQDGRYVFAGAPSLGPGEKYYVRFQNDDDPRHVRGWWGPDLSAYQAGQSQRGGDFDIANVELLTPSGVATVFLPAQFEWARRGFGSHTYRWQLWDEVAGRSWESPDLGDTGDFTLAALPDGWPYDREYAWSVRVLQAGNGFGRSFAQLPVHFVAPSPPPTPVWRTTVDDRFCDPASGWPTGDTANARYGYLIGMGCEYQIQLKSAARYQWVSSRRSITGDYALAATGHPLGRGWFGLAFGATPARDRLYAYMIGSSGQYGLWRNDAGTWTRLVPPTASALVDPAFGNTLRVENVGGEMRLLLDGEQLGTFNDGLSHDGEYGMYAESIDAGSDARFTRYVVAEAP